MIDLAFFVLILATGALTLGWYVVNVERRSPGAAGLLALRSDNAGAYVGARSAYVEKARSIRRSTLSTFPGQEPASGRYRAARVDAAYRSVQGASYAARGDAYRERQARAPETVS